MTSVVHCKSGLHYDVYVGRPSIWGNRFVVGIDGTRAEVILKFEEWVRSQPELVARIKEELRGRVLGCWCRPDQLCHGRVLAAIADEG
jgi:hypothetical protein